MFDYFWLRVYVMWGTFPESGCAGAYVDFLAYYLCAVYADKVFPHRAGIFNYFADKKKKQSVLTHEMQKRQKWSLDLCSNA